MLGSPARHRPAARHGLLSELCGVRGAAQQFNPWARSDQSTAPHPREQQLARGEPSAPYLRFAWKAVYTAKDTWLGQTENLGGLPALYSLTMDPFEKYDMFFNGATSTRGDFKTSPGRWAGLDNGWATGLTQEVLIDFDKSIIKYPNIQRSAGGSSTDLIPDLQNPKNPVPALDPNNPPKISGAGG